MNGWMDGQMDRFPLFYRTLSPQVPSGAAAQKVGERWTEREDRKGERGGEKGRGGERERGKKREGRKEAEIRRESGKDHKTFFL